MNFINKMFLKLSAPQKIALSFVLVILSGTIFLMMPYTNRNGIGLNLLDALFTATSATCVTGLVTVITMEQFNLLGQIVILTLIQIGGLGLMTIAAIFIIQIKTRLSLNDKLLMKEMLNQDSLYEMHNFIRYIIKYTLIFEGIGAILLAIRFIPEFGFAQGTFNSVFIAISAFCNAGFDNLSMTSLMPYASDPLINLTVMSLIALGGIGFTVWFDFAHKIKQLKGKKFRITKLWKILSLHTKIVLIMTGTLILAPAVTFFILEFNNPGTIGTLSLFDKMMACLFQSVTLRTAGFATIDYAFIRPATEFLMIITMFIGGSPGGTAGGVKTTTIAVLLLLVISQLKKGDDVVVFRRSISIHVLIRAITIVMINLITLISGIFILTITENVDFIHIVFEAVSAMATVGLTTGITMGLTAVGKIVIITLMFIGRIGIITLIISILKGKGTPKTITYPCGNVIVG